MALALLSGARPTLTDGDRSDSIDDVAEWYRRKLSEPAELPWVGGEWEPIRIGPTWQTDDRGRWLLPRHTIGWDVLGWCGIELQHKRGRPWRFTLEQARFVLWWYSVDESGVWIFNDFVLQRLKGWGKDPLAATLCATELVGPCRFDGWDDDGRPLAADEEAAWVQTAAVSKTQTRNTTRLFPGLFTPAAKAFYDLTILATTIYAGSDERILEAVTSSPLALEGARPTFVLKNETQHWQANNNGIEMADVIERNATKSEGGAARTGAITNAFDPSIDSVGQRDRDAYEAAAEGEAVNVGILYDSLEAPPEAPLTAEAAPGVVRSIRGDSIWLSEARIVKSILDVRNPPSRSRRFWYNQIGAAEDAWVDPLWFDPLSRPALGVGRDIMRAGSRTPGEWVLFFDGSKSDDATALVACRLDDGHCVTVGMWQKPPQMKRDERWTVPRVDVDARVEQAFRCFNIVGFWADPSHVRDDETLDRYWDGLIDDWHNRYREQLRRLPANPGKDGHAVSWDMASHERSERFTAAAEKVRQEIEDGELTWDGDGRLRTHVHNARRFPNRWGVSLWKGHRESARKIDLAVCMVGARMMRRELLVGAATKKRSGVVW